MQIGRSVIEELKDENPRDLKRRKDFDRRKWQAWPYITPTPQPFSQLIENRPN